MDIQTKTKSELDNIRDILHRCDVQIASTEEDLEELHLIEHFRRKKAEANKNPHTSGRHLVSIERIEVSNASIIALKKTKEEQKKRLREIVGEVKKVIRASASATVVDTTVATCNNES